MTCACAHCRASSFWNTRSMDIFPLKSPRDYWRPSAVPNCEIVALQQLFSGPTHSKSRKPWRIFLTPQRLSFNISSTVLAGYCICAEHGGLELWFTWCDKDYNCLTVHHCTCMNCLPQPRFPSSLSLTILPFRISDFRVFLRLPQAIGSISLGDNVITVKSFCNRSWSSVPVCAYLESVWDARALAVILASKISPLSSLSKTEDAFIRRANMVTLRIGVQCQRHFGDLLSFVEI